MRKFFFLSIVVFIANLVAGDNQYLVRGVYGWATSKDVGEILVGKISPDSTQYKVYSIDGGYKLWSDLNDWPVDIYAKAGLNYYDEGQYNNTYGSDIYIKAFYNIDFADNRVRFGFGEGLSYTIKTLKIEEIDAVAKDSPTSKFLNYLDISLDVDLGRLFGSKSWRDLYCGVLIKHRSGVFGLFNGVHGGSNYNSFYIEKNF